MSIVKSVVEKAGLQFQMRDNKGDPATRSFKRGYDRAKSDAVKEKLGKEKSFQMAGIILGMGVPKTP